MAHVTIAGEARLARVICLAGDAPGDCLYVTGPEVGGALQVAKADLSTIAKMPAIGVLLSKATPTSGVAVLSGFFTPGFALTPNARMWIGPTGVLVGTRPAAPAFLQVMGRAVDAARVLISPSTEMCKVI